MVDEIENVKYYLTEKDKRGSFRKEITEAAKWIVHCRTIS